jgi:hypothetical protein
MTTTVTTTLPVRTRRVGRKALPPAARRSQQTVGLVTNAEHALFLAEAARQGKTLSGLLRDRLTGAIALSSVAGTGESRHCRLKTLLTAAQGEALTARADALGVSLSDLVRHLAVGVPLPPPLPLRQEDLAAAS